MSNEDGSVLWVPVSKKLYGTRQSQREELRLIEQDMQRLGWSYAIVDERRDRYNRAQYALWRKWVPGDECYELIRNRLAGKLPGIVVYQWPEDVAHEAA